MSETSELPNQKNAIPEFRWICLGVAVVALLGLGWFLNEVRGNLKRTADTLNNDLPRILKNTKAGTEMLKNDLPRILKSAKAATDMLKDLAQDVKNLRDLAGVSSGSRDRSLVTYADSLLDFLEKQPAKIGKKKLIGKSLSNPVPAGEWVVGARREALYQSFRAKSRRQMLERLAKTLTGKNWYIQFNDDKPILLLDWALANHPESAKLAVPDKTEGQKEPKGKTSAKKRS